MKMRSGENTEDRYSIVEDALPPKSPGPPVHVHRKTNEAFYVVKGFLKFQIGTETIQDLHYSAPGERGVRLQRQALPGPVVHDGQHAEAPAGPQGIRHEVHRPPFIGARRLRERRPQARHALSTPPTDRQMLGLLESEHTLVIHHPAFAAQQHMQTPVPVPRPLPGQGP